MALFLVGLAALVAAVPTFAKGPKPRPRVHCSDGRDEAIPFVISVDGEEASGRYALPRGAPKGLVVFAHGYGHTTASWAEHLKRTSRDLGVISVGMDYRGIEISPDSSGDGLPESRGWNVWKGAEDSVAAAQLFYDTCRMLRNRMFVIMGVSMGGNSSGLAVASNPRDSRGDPLFDYWIDVEGAVNMTETYLSARAIAPVNAFGKQAQDDIEKETGGPIEEQPEEFRKRTVVARSADIEASGIKGVVMIHGLDDGLVPYNQSRELDALLTTEGIPTEMVTISRRSQESERETTATGYAMGPVYPAITGEEWTSPFAGHGSEKSTTHIVMVTGFEWLEKLFNGHIPTGNNQHLVDGGYTP